MYIIFDIKSRKPITAYLYDILLYTLLNVVLPVSHNVPVYSV